MIYLELFWSFFQIGLFSIGGGYAALPLIREQVTEIHHWLDMTAFIDIVTISQMTPGPIAINAATFVGTQVGGLPGAVIATVGCVTPSCIIVLFLAWLYYKYRQMTVIQGVLGGLRPAVVSLIAAAGLSILITAFWTDGVVTPNLSDIDFAAVVLFAIALFVLRKWRPNPIYVMIGTGVVGGVIYGFGLV